MRARKEMSMRSSYRVLSPLLFLALGCQGGEKSGEPAAGAASAPVAPASSGGGQVVAKIGGQTITMDDLDKKAGREIFEIRERTLDNMIAEQLLEGEAKKANQTIEQWVRAEAERRVPMVSEQEAEAFFTQNQARIPQFQGKTFADAKDMVMQGLTQQKRGEEISKIVEELKKTNGVEVMLEAPRVVVKAEGPAKGPENAPVTIVEFSDFQCPYCSKAAATVHEVLKAYDGKVRVVFRDYPLPFHKDAAKASEAAHCADEQGKFWEMHDWMFANQSGLAVDNLKAQAGTLGLDTAKFNECLDSGKFAKVVETNTADGKEAGVTGTPAFFVNGVFLNGAVPMDKFKEAIDKELARAAK